MHQYIESYYPMVVTFKWGIGKGGFDTTLRFNIFLHEVTAHKTQISGFGSPNLLSLHHTMAPVCMRVCFVSMCVHVKYMNAEMQQKSYGTRHKIEE